MKRVVITIVAVFFAAPLLLAQDAAKVAVGKKAYETQKCATCHKLAGQGGSLASSLDGVAKKLSEADIKKWLTVPAEMETKLNPKPKMPMSAYLKTHKLTDADVNGLVAYLMTLK